MDTGEFTDHELFTLLKEQDAAAWTVVWEKAVLAEARSLRSSELARKWGVSPESMMSDLYDDMIAKGRLNLYRDDGGSVIGWLRRYVRGYVMQANPARRREVSLDSAFDGDDGDGRALSEKIPAAASESASGTSFTSMDPDIGRRETWEMVQSCFRKLWRKHPKRAYVHLLKLRMNLSSAEIRDMLGISTQANVDQLFSRAVKAMQEARCEYEKDN